MSETGTWLEGPPKESGLYWFQVQGSGMIRFCEVTEHRGELIIGNWNYDGKSIPVLQPYRRWMSGGYPKPMAELDWLDPRYIADRRGR